MPWPFLIALAGIAWLAYMGYLDHQQKLAKQGGDARGFQKVLGDLLVRLEEAEAEQTRLQQRVENLEAIVTSESFDLDREAQQALRAARPAAETSPRLALDDAEEEDGEARAPGRTRRREA